MKNKCFALLLGIVFICTANIFAGGGKNDELSKNAFTAADTLCTPNPSREAVVLYRYLLDMKNQLSLSGQMWTQWNINEMDYVENNTGKLPAIAGFDFIHESDNNIEIQRAINYWKSGGIPTIMWHWGAPGIGSGYQNSLATINIDSCFTPGTTQYNDFWAELTLKADHLQILRDSGVPIIWRPFHECSGDWFWWSKGGPGKLKQLWITMFDYFVNDRGLNNLIWTQCFDSSPDTAWFPGHQYVDIVGGDNYSDISYPLPVMHSRCELVEGDHNYPICFHECQTPPNPYLCLSYGYLWSWFMIWHTNLLQAVSISYLQDLYNSEVIVSLDELPDFMTEYNWNDSCYNSTISPAMKIDTGDWTESHYAVARAGSEVRFKITVSADGTLTWEGCDITGDSTEQTITVTRTCTAIAKFTNTCGATSTQTFTILLDDSPIIDAIPEFSNSKFNIKIYPNPSKDFINIELNSQNFITSGVITFYNPDGSVIFSKNVNDRMTAFDISNLAEGFYLIKFENEGYEEMHKFLKIK